MPGVLQVLSDLLEAPDRELLISKAPTKGAFVMTATQRGLYYQAVRLARRPVNGPYVSQTFSPGPGTA